LGEIDMGFFDNKFAEVTKKIIIEAENSTGLKFEEIIFEELPHVSMRHNIEKDKVLIVFNFNPSFSESAIMWRSATIISLRGLSKFNLIVNKDTSTVLTPFSMFGTKVNNYINIIKIEYDNAEKSNQVINCLDAVKPVLNNNRMQLFINLMGEVKDRMANYIVKEPVTEKQNNKSSNLQKLIEAKEMLNLKLISQEEFDKLKSKIIEE
jgi:hypothetical protein